MPDRTFLEKYGLYRKFPYEDAVDGKLSGVPSPSIQSYCLTCKGVRTWNENTGVRHRVGSTPHSLTDFRHGLPMPAQGASSRTFEDQPIRGCAFAVEYACTDCKRQRVTFIIAFGCRNGEYGKVDQRRFLETVQQPPGYGYVMKIGQYPPWSIDPPQELKSALGEHEHLYKRGMVCESQNYGIGAFAYYRRIVEKIIDQMLEDVAQLLEPADREKYQAQLAAAQGTRVAGEKIAVVKDMLPPTLRPRGVNPLDILHKALSVGIHSLEEDTCLELAEGIRKSLAMLAKHIALAKHDMDDYAAGLTKVKDRLDKWKRKKGQSHAD